MENSYGTNDLIDTKTSKIIISDDEDNFKVKFFFNSIVEFIRDNNIDVIVLKIELRKEGWRGFLSILNLRH